MWACPQHRIGDKPPGVVVPLKATVVFSLGLPSSSLVLPRPVYPRDDLLGSKALSPKALSLSTLGDGLSFKLWASGVQRW